MNVKNLFKNLLAKAEVLSSTAEENAKDYADTLVNVEDFTSSVTVNSTYLNTVSASAKRYGKLGFLMYRLTAKTNFSPATDIPFLTLPHTIASDLGNMMFFIRSSSSVTRPVMKSVNNQVFQDYVGNAQSGDSFEFIFIYVIGGVTKLLIYLASLLNRRVVMAW